MPLSVWVVGAGWKLTALIPPLLTAIDVLAHHSHAGDGPGEPGDELDVQPFIEEGLLAQPT